MLTPRINPDNWQEALKFINRCPVCSAAYNIKEAKVFAKSESANLIHITCVTCRSFFIAMIVVLGHGLSSVGMITDLSFEDAKRLHKMDEITVDEMIEGYETLHAEKFIKQLNNSNI